MPTGEYSSPASVSSAYEEYVPPPAFTLLGSFGHVLAASPVDGMVSKLQSRLPVAAAKARMWPIAP